MNELNAEMLAKLPYQDLNHPATSDDVVKEFTLLVVALASIISVNPSWGAKVIEDTTKEPGRTVAVQQTRTALALESWLARSGMDLIESLGEALQEHSE